MTYRAYTVFSFFLKKIYSDGRAVGNTISVLIWPTPHYQDNLLFAVLCCTETFDFRELFGKEQQFVLHKQEIILDTE